MGWWEAIPVVISAASSIYSASQASDQAKTQQNLGVYNSTAQKNVATINLLTQMAVGKYNAKAAIQSAEFSTEASREVTKFNAEVIQATAEYNNSLLDSEEALMYEAMGLDLLHLKNNRARERGSMVARQGASGTLIGDGSNADVVTDQMAQEALDTFVIRHGADIQAAKLSLARAQNTWNADMQASKIIWEGEVGAQVTMNNARLQAGSSMANVALANTAGTMTRDIQYNAGIYGANAMYSTTSAKINNGLTTGLFTAAGQGIYTAYRSKEPEPLDTSSLVASSAGSTSGSLLISTPGMNFSGR